jgi:hypothetical protein
MRPLWELADLVREVRRRLRYGELSRAPLRLLRVEWREASAECDWIARTADAWDADLKRLERERNESRQALADAIAVRHLIFDAFPAVDCALLRAFRQPAREPPEPILLGSVSREVPSVNRVSSLVMRAKLYGFCFSLEDGVLKPLQIGDRAEVLIS